MKRILVLIAASLMTVFLSCKDEPTDPVTPKPAGWQDDIPWPSLAASSWPMFRHDPQNTGRSKIRGPKTGLIKWTYNGNYFLCEATTGSDSNNFIADAVGISVLNNNGEKLWGFTLDTQILTAPLHSKSGHIYFTDALEGKLLALDTAGVKQWEFDLRRQTFGRNTINIDKSGNIYMLSGIDMLCLSENGSLLWAYTDNRFNSDCGGIAFSPDGNTLYIPGINVSLLALNINTKSIEWIFGDKMFEGCPLVDAQNNVYIIPVDRRTEPIEMIKVYALTGSGNVRWEYPVFYPASTGLYNKSAAMDKNGNISFAADTLYSLNYSGKLRWKIGLEGISDAPPVIDNEGNVIVATQSGAAEKVYLYGFSSEGHENWKLGFSHKQTGPSPSIVADGRIIFIPWRGNSVYCIE